MVTFAINIQSKFCHVEEILLYGFGFKSRRPFPDHRSLYCFGAGGEETREDTRVLADEEGTRRKRNVEMRN